MEYVLTILRFLHIILGVLWVGLGVTAAWILHPLASQIGDEGSQMLRAWYSKSRFAQIMPVASIGTTVAGLILWGMRADGPLLEGFTNTGSMVMGVGALFGLLAFGHGFGISRIISKFSGMLDSSETKNDELSEMEAKLGRNANIGAILTVIAVTCMSLARYI